MHYRHMYEDNGMLYAWDLQGREFVLTIKHVAAGDVVGEKGRKTKKPIVTFGNAKKKFALNKTNGKTIAQLYGPDTREWVGKSVTLYATTTQDAKGETVECIRIRPQVPKGPASKESPEASGPPPMTDEERREIEQQEARRG